MTTRITNQPTIKQKTAHEYCVKYPRAASRAIARMLHKDHPKLFPNIDGARVIVVRIRAVPKSHVDVSNRMRHTHCTLSAPREPGWQEMMPKSVAAIREPYRIDGPEEIFLMNDIHFPYHDEQALAAAIAWGIKRKPTTVLLNGDILENYGISRWEPDPRKRDVNHELKVTAAGLKCIRNAFPKAKILFKLGNHEDRWEHYMIKNCEALLNVEQFKLSQLLKFDELKITEVGTRQIVRAGRLAIVHGHELPKGISNPVNPARGVYLRLAETAMCGHFHQTSQHTDNKGLSKKHITCWSVGCLCDLSPDYAIANNWNHGCAAITVHADGNFEVTNASIINGEVF